jgi:very-short-patch-repair endonuclease
LCREEAVMLPVENDLPSPLPDESVQGSNWRVLKRKLRHPADVHLDFRAESPIEERLMRLVLEASPGVDVTARYVLAFSEELIREFVKCAARERFAPKYLVFPQAEIASYRVDFVLAARIWSPGAYHVWIVEADGAAYHSQPDQVRRDIDRQFALRQKTGWDILRFGGAEISFAAPVVGDVLEAYLMATAPDPYCTADSARDRLRRKVHGVAVHLASLPAHRDEYVHPASHARLNELRALVEELKQADGTAPFG